MKQLIWAWFPQKASLRQNQNNESSHAPTLFGSAGNCMWESVWLAYVQASRQHPNTVLWLTPSILAKPLTFESQVSILKSINSPLSNLKVHHLGSVSSMSFPKCFPLFLAGLYQSGPSSCLCIGCFLESRDCSFTLRICWDLIRVVSLEAIRVVSYKHHFTSTCFQVSSCRKRQFSSGKREGDITPGLEISEEFMCSMF